MLGYSLFQLLTFAVLGGGILIAARSRQIRVAGPTLVLRRFDHTADAASVVIQGRASGVIGWLLTTMGLDVDTTLNVTSAGVSVKTAGLAGEIRDVAPLSEIASTVCGYAKPAWALVIGVMFAAYGILTLLFQRGDADAGSVLVPIVIAAFFIVFYVLSQRLIIAVETSGGRMLGVAFKRSIIENTTVSVEQALAATETINRLVASAKRAPVI